MGVKLKADYSAVLHMPVLKEGKDRVPQHPGSMQGYTQPGQDSTTLLRIMALCFLFVCFNVGFQHFGLCIHVEVCVPTFIFQERIQIISSQELMLILLVLVSFLNRRPLASQSSSLVFISCFSSSVFTFLPLIMWHPLLSFTSCLFAYFSVLFYLFSLPPTLLWPHSFLFAPRVWL